MGVGRRRRRIFAAAATGEIDFELWARFNMLSVNKL
jgi:hypothetical protein